MKRMRFNAQELFVMATAAGKRRMFGIPDSFARLDEAEAIIVKQQTASNLLDEGVLEMDFDGHINVSMEYKEFPDIYCDCRKCLTLNRQMGEEGAEDLMFWQLKGKFFQAEADENSYLFYEVNRTEIETEVLKENWTSTDPSDVTEAVISQIALKKAKRYAQVGNRNETMRILMQNGADVRTSAVLADGLEEKARFLRLVLMNIKPNGLEEEEKSWLNSRETIYNIRSKVVDFRSSSVFTSSWKGNVVKEIKTLLSAFLSEE